jgi:ribonuclease D
VPPVEPPDVTPLVEPADGVPPVIETADALAACVAAFGRGSGPLAADAERASGYRYGQRTYLVQLRREGAGTALIDPIALPDLSALSAALEGVEWILHAASQDLPGFVPLGLKASVVFDTELAARLLGMDRVGLAAVVAEILGLGLAKEHSAVDWSTRPLRPEWLRYAALDVEVLIELRVELGRRLDEAGKGEWARQEFEAVRLAPPPSPRVDPWRRTSGMHVLREPRALAVVRELWTTREETAARQDISPGRILPDAAILAAAQAMPRSVVELTRLPAFSGKGQRRRAPQWQLAIDRALALPESALPPRRGPQTDAPPPARSWPDRDPAAAQRLAAARGCLGELAEQYHVPTENMLQPDLLRRLCWAPPARLDVASIEQRLLSGGARRWQVELVAAPLVVALATAPSPLSSSASSSASESASESV